MTAEQSWDLEYQRQRVKAYQIAANAIRIWGWELLRELPEYTDGPSRCLLLVGQEDAAQTLEALAEELEFLTAQKEMRLANVQ